MSKIQRLNRLNRQPGRHNQIHGVVDCRGDNEIVAVVSLISLARISIHAELMQLMRCRARGLTLKVKESGQSGRTSIDDPALMKEVILSPCANNSFCLQWLPLSIERCVSLCKVRWLSSYHCRLAVLISNSVCPLAFPLDTAFLSRICARHGQDAQSTDIMCL